MIRLFVALAFVLVASVSTAPADALTKRLEFTDEGPKDTSFLKFRNALKAIIARKDARALLAVLSTDITIDFGGFGGRREFAERWKPSEKDSQVWAVLSLVVEQGGKFDGKTRFSAPYVFSAFPSDVDPTDNVVVINDGALMRVKPSVDAKRVRKLDRDILTIVNLVNGDSIMRGSYLAQHEAGDHVWYEVRDARGARGFVQAKDVRSPIDYRARFEKRKGKWLMTMFIAGD